MISASLNRCKGMEDQVGDFLKQLAAKLELVLLIFTSNFTMEMISLPMLLTKKYLTKEKTI